MRVNIKFAIRSHRLAGARNSVPQGQLKVAHYKVVGIGIKNSSVPEGQSNPQFLARIRPSGAQQPIDRPLRDGSLLKKRDPPLRSGLLSNGPFLLRPAVARSTKEASWLPTSPNCPQSFIEGWGYVGQAGTRSSPNATLPMLTRAGSCRTRPTAS